MFKIQLKTNHVGEKETTGKETKKKKHTRLLNWIKFEQV